MVLSTESEELLGEHPGKRGGPPGQVPAPGEGAAHGQNWTWSPAALRPGSSPSRALGSVSRGAVPPVSVPQCSHPPIPGGPGSPGCQSEQWGSREELPAFQAAGSPHRPRPRLPHACPPQSPCCEGRAPSPLPTLLESGCFCPGGDRCWGQAAQWQRVSSPTLSALPIRVPSQQPPGP